jgi:hypothetical protein
MIYWIEHDPNPWVRAIAITVLGGIAWFNHWSGADIPDMSQWLGGYGACTTGPFINSPYRTGAQPAKSRDKRVALLRSLTLNLGPVAGMLAFQTVIEEQTGKKLSDAALVKLLKKAFPPLPEA